MYFLPGCPFCIKARELLIERGVEINEVDISQPEGRAELGERGDYKTVPQIFIEDKNIGGHDDLVALIEKDKFEELFN